MTEMNATPTRTTYPEGFNFDAPQTAKMLGISPNQLKRLITRGIIKPAVVRGTSRQSNLFAPEDVHKLVASGGVQHLVLHRGQGKAIGQGTPHRLLRIEAMLAMILERLDEFQLRPPTGK